MSSVDSDCEEVEDAFENDVVAASFSDMLLDDERNVKYARAIERAVRFLKSPENVNTRESTCGTVDRNKGEAVSELPQTEKVGVSVLDIGTGTGLLAMIAARAGARHVTACEMSLETAAIAVKVVEGNGLSDVVTVVRKRSDALTVAQSEGDRHGSVSTTGGNSVDMPGKVDLIVMEVFDTDLIGEGVLPTMRDALRRLARPGAMVVPGGARMYGQLVSSPHLATWQRLSASASASASASLHAFDMRPKEGCVGSGFLHSAQLDAYSAAGLIKPLSPPICLFEFDFRRPCDAKHAAKYVKADVECDGVAHAVVVWWDLLLDDTETISTRPEWIAFGFGVDAPQWRDHWTQAVAVLPTPLELSVGASVTLGAFHDDYNVWVTAEKDVGVPEVTLTVTPPYCFCGAHGLWSRHRIAALCDEPRSATFQRALKDTLQKRLQADSASSFSTSPDRARGDVTVEKTHIVCVGSGPWLAMSAARASDDDVVVVAYEEERLSREISERIVSRNGMALSVAVVGGEDWPRHASGGAVAASAILCEPSFDGSLLPWDDMLHAWKTAARLVADGHVRRRAEGIGEIPLVFPARARVRCAAVQLDHLHKSVADIREAVGFDLGAFNTLRTRAKEHVTAYPMGEYSHSLLSGIEDVCDIDERVVVTESDDDGNEGGALAYLGKCVLSVSSVGKCHGILAWVDYDLCEGVALRHKPRPWGDKFGLDDADCPMYARHAVVFLHGDDFGASVVPGDRLLVSVSASAEQGVLCIELSLVRTE